MKIYDSVYDDLWSASGLDREGVCVISVVGAGGKSHLIKHFSEVLNQKCISHFVVTTTHMWPMDTGIYGRQIGAVNSEGKVEPPDEKMWDYIFSTGYPVLIEADGAKGFPCKAPAKWEPVIRRETTHVFAVLGMQCLGSSVKSVCHRKEYVQKLLNCSEEHKINIDDLVCLFSDENGLKKDVTNRHKYYVVCNQVDDLEGFEMIHPIKKLLEGKGIENVYFTKMKDKN